MRWPRDSATLPGSSIDDCRTQRNLSLSGRDQARRIGAYLRNETIDIRVILSSRWCRCVETAAELGLGPFTTHDGLNSFFDGHVDRDETIELLRAQLDRTAGTRTDGQVTLMVTHQVVITDHRHCPAKRRVRRLQQPHRRGAGAGTPVKP